MKRFKRDSTNPLYWGLLTLLLLLTPVLMVGCGDDDDDNGTDTDTTAPTVVSIDPAGGATNVPMDKVITIVFSETLAPATVTTSTVTVSDVTGTVVSDGAIVTFTPSSALSPSTPYTVTLTTSITDQAGNALAATYTSTFTTGTGTGGSASVYTSGTFSFTYTKIGIPPDAGTFSIDGSSLAPDGTIPTGITEVCGGAMVPNQSGSGVFCYGGELQTADTTVDIAFVVLNSETEEITTGTYNVSVVDPISVFGYIEGIDDFDLPPSFEPDDIIAWAEALNAERMFVSASGTIVITTLSETAFAGQFSGSMVSETAIFTVSAGSFSVSSGI